MTERVKISARLLPPHEQEEMSYAAIGKIMDMLLRQGIEPSNALAGLLAAAISALSTFGDESDQKKTITWLRDTAAYIEQQPRLN